MQNTFFFKLDFYLRLVQQDVRREQSMQNHILQGHESEWLTHILRKGIHFEDLT